MNRVRCLLIATLAVGAAVVLAPTALAGGSIHKSTVTVEGFTPLDTDFFEVFGAVASETRQCFANRTVKLSAQTSPAGPFKPFDTAKTGAKGGWAGIGHSTCGVDAIKAVLPKSKFGPQAPPRICGAAIGDVHSRQVIV